MNTVIVFAASYLYLIILALSVIIFVLVDRSTKIKIVKLAIIVLPLCFIIALLSGTVIASPRPFVVEHIEPLIQSSTDNGFPSDHTLLSMVVAAIIFAYSRKWGSLLLGLAVVVGVARVLAQVHHPIDVIGSIVIASVTTYLVYRFVVEKIHLKILEDYVRAG